MTSQSIALITGGSRGLGRSAAQHLARCGTDVLLTYNKQADHARATVEAIRREGGHAECLQLDMTASEDFPSFKERLKDCLQSAFSRSTFDYLVNNAGYGIYKAFGDFDGEDLDRLYKVHVKGPFLLTQTLAELIADDGRVLNVSSGLTRITLSGHDAYAAMKGAVEVMTRYQATALASRRIAVNTVAPGAIETDFGGGAVRDNEALNRHLAENTAMGRVGLPDDIGSAVAGLLTAGSQWMTAQRIEVSGGQGM